MKKLFLQYLIFIPGIIFTIVSCQDKSYDPEFPSTMIADDYFLYDYTFSGTGIERNFGTSIDFEASLESQDFKLKILEFPLQYSSIGDYNMVVITRSNGGFSQGIRNYTSLFGNGTYEYDREQIIFRDINGLVTVCDIELLTSKGILLNFSRSYTDSSATAIIDYEIEGQVSFRRF